MNLRNGERVTLISKDFLNLLQEPGRTRAFGRSSLVLPDGGIHLVDTACLPYLGMPALIKGSHFIGGSVLYSLDIDQGVYRWPVCMFFNFWADYVQKCLWQALYERGSGGRVKPVAALEKSVADAYNRVHSSSRPAEAGMAQSGDPPFCQTRPDGIPQSGDPPPYQTSYDPSKPEPKVVPDQRDLPPEDSSYESRIFIIDTSERDERPVSVELVRKLCALIEGTPLTCADGSILDVTERGLLVSPSGGGRSVLYDVMGVMIDAV